MPASDSRLFLDAFNNEYILGYLENKSTDHFRGLERVAFEYIKRFNADNDSSHLIFGSRLPHIVSHYLKLGGIEDNISNPGNPTAREKSLSFLNRIDHAVRKKSEIAHLPLALARKLLVANLDDHPYIPYSPCDKDIYLKFSGSLIPPIQSMPWKRVLLCHDLSLVKHFDVLGISSPVYDTKYTPAMSLSNRDWAICISDYTRNALLEILPDFPKDRAFVVHNGSDIPEYKTRTRTQLALKYGFPDHRYFLSLSAGAPHKNTKYVIEEYSKWRISTSTDENAPNLLLAGRNQEKIRNKLSLEARRLISDGAIHFTGFVEDGDLPSIYQHASVFVFASLVEGFGLPPLEAMHNGCPVFCSNQTSLPEVVGDAAHLFNPYESGALAKLFDTAFLEKDLLKKLILKGKIRAAEFSWDHSYQKLKEVLSIIRDSR